MPRGNANVWKQHGASYAELAGTSTSAEREAALAPRRLPPVATADVAAVRALPAAGTPGSKLPRGAGTFVMQAGWSLGGQGAGGAASGADGGACGAAGPSGRAAGATETRSNYRPPPPDYKRQGSARMPPSQMPRPDYKNDWRTSKQADFSPDALSRLDPSRPAVAKDSGRLLPQDVPPGAPGAFATATRSQFVGHTQAEVRRIPMAGGKGTQAAGYNIITGASAYTNNAFEHWDGRDYRRHR